MLGAREPAVAVVVGEVAAMNTFRCAGCGRRVPWSEGAGDDMPEHCDDCWATAHASDDEPGAIPAADLSDVDTICATCGHRIPSCTCGRTKAS